MSGQFWHIQHLLYSLHPIICFLFNLITKLLLKSISFIHKKVIEVFFNVIFNTKQVRTYLLLLEQTS